MTPEQIDRRIQTVQTMIASYSLTLANHKINCGYVERKISEYDHELDNLLDKRKELA